MEQAERLGVTQEVGVKLGLEEVDGEVVEDWESDGVAEGLAEGEGEEDIEQDRVASEDGELVALGVRQRVGELEGEGAVDVLRAGVEVFVGLGVGEVEGEAEGECDAEALVEGDRVADMDADMLRVWEAWADKEVVAL